MYICIYVYMYICIYIYIYIYNNSKNKVSHAIHYNTISEFQNTHRTLYIHKSTIESINSSN